MLALIVLWLCSPAQDEPVYQLPWEAGRAYLVTQGYLGAYSHKDAYALDFDMPQGSAVHAARAGRVSFVKEDSDKGGAEEKYLPDANVIVIHHGDGSQATYAHLRKDGAEVQVGEFVFAGDLIGYSGATGFAQAPHLHFEVHKEGKSSEVRFADNSGQPPLIPREGRRYTSANKPTVPREKKDALKHAMEEAELGMKYDVYAAAHAAYRRVIDLKLPESEPVKKAREGLDEITRRADERVGRIDGWLAAGQTDAATEEALLSVRRWAGTPSEGKFADLLDSKLRSRPEFRKVLARMWVLLRQQTMFIVALRLELEGRADEARRVYAETDKLDPNAYCAGWARERLK